MKLTREGLKETALWEKAGISLPGYDVEAVSKALKNEMEFVVSEYPVYGKYIEKNRAIEILHSGVIPQKSQEGPDGKRLREREEFFEER